MSEAAEKDATCNLCGHARHDDNDCDVVTGYDHLNGDHDCGCPGYFTVEIDEDPQAEAAWLRSLGLDPETATVEDLNRILPPAKTDEERA